MRKSKPSQDRVKTITLLAKKLGFNRCTVSQWTTIHDDAPKPNKDGHSLSEWREFVNRHNLGEKARQVKSSDKSLHDARRIAAIADREEFRLAIQKKQFVKSSEVAQLIEHMEHETTRLLREKFENQLPADCFGRDLETIRSINEAAINLVCAQRQEMWRKAKGMIK